MLFLLRTPILLLDMQTCQSGEQRYEKFLKKWMNFIGIVGEKGVFQFFLVEIEQLEGITKDASEQRDVGYLPTVL